MTVGKKFSLACGALVLLTIASGGVSIAGIGNINRHLQAIVADSLPGVYRIGQLESLGLEMRGDAWTHIASPDKSLKEQMEREWATGKQQYRENLSAYEKTISIPDDRRMFERIPPAFDRYASAWDGVVPLSREGKTAEAAAKYISDVEPASRELQEAVQQLVAWNKSNGDRNAAAATATVTAASFWSWSLLVISVVVGSALAMVITGSVNGALSRAVRELTEGAEQLARASSQVSSSSHSLAMGSSEQAASLEQTSASTEEIQSMARKNSENSRAAAELMTKSQQKFVRTNELLDQSVVAMGEISTQSDRISRIIKTIDEIAFQTNILALNAAVEAARAGDAGMGFAVVAEEVRSLAHRCAQAAKDTAGLIEESITKSNDGKVKVDQVATSIKAITEEIAKVKRLVDDVNVGSAEQSRGVEQIGNAIAQMEKVTQNASANAEEGAAAAAELNGQSEALKGVVQRLTAMVRSTP